MNDMNLHKTLGCCEENRSHCLNISPLPNSQTPKAGAQLAQPAHFTAGPQQNAEAQMIVIQRYSSVIQQMIIYN